MSETASQLPSGKLSNTGMFALRPALKSAALPGYFTPQREAS